MKTIAKLALVLPLGAALALSAGCEKKEGTPALPKSMTDAAKKAEDAAKAGIEKGKEAAAGALDALKGNMDGYLKNLGSLGGMLEGIKTEANATEAKPKLAEMIGSINGLTDKLGGAGGDMKGKLTEMFKGQLGPAVEKVQAQISRISSDAKLGPILGDTLKGLKIFQ
ncbi:MAG: hypothetical protein IBJ11_09895 [Phycisphaerales bacterium]|nr:hypothetical protein [Phycisphaerales bacterium]